MSVPGPSMPGPVQVLAWTMRPGAFLEGCRRRYGNTFRLRLLGFGERGFSEVVFCAEPASIKTVFTAGPDTLRVGELRAAMAPMFGTSSILLLDGQRHMRQRKLMLPPFHGERMARYGELIAAATERELATWPLGRSFPLQPRMQAVTYDVIMQAVFGLDEPERRAEVGGALRRALDIVANPLSEVMMGLPGKIGPINVRAGFERAVAEADAVLFAEIARRRAEIELAEREDILSLLLQARDENGEPMSDRELRDELVTLLLAGHETTATALAWAFDYLLRDHKVLDRLTEECRGGGGGEDYLEAVVHEVLRLRPPIAFVDRRITRPLELDGHLLPPGTIVAPCIYLAHRRPDLYPEPNAFRPERFLERPPETYSWLPFGGGVRRCVGASFATFEMKLVLKVVLRSARLRPASERPERAVRRAIVLAPRHGTRAVLEERRAKVRAYSNVPGRRPDPVTPVGSG
jgi:cytochrome P450 family 135